MPSASSSHLIEDLVRDAFDACDDVQTVTLARGAAPRTYEVRVVGFPGQSVDLSAAEEAFFAAADAAAMADASLLWFGDALPPPGSETLYTIDL